MKNKLLLPIAVGLMNTMANASSYCMDSDFENQRNQVLRALQIFASEVKPSTHIVEVSRRAAVATEIKDSVGDEIPVDPVDVANLTAEAIAEELVPIAGKTKSLNIPGADYITQMKKCGQQFEGLAKAVDDALKPAYNVAVGNVCIFPQLPSESLASLHSQESALKKQLKELNAKDYYLSDYMEYSDSDDEEESDRTRNCHRNDKQHKESEAKKEQIKKQLQALAEKIKQFKASKKHVRDLELFKSKMLAHQNNAKADNFKITKSTARLKLLFEQANSARQKKFHEQSAALTNSLENQLVEIDKDFEEKCRVARQKAAQLIEKNPDQAHKAKLALAVDIDLYAKKHKTLKRLAKLQSESAKALHMHELAADLASFKFDYEKTLADFENAAEIAALIISGDDHKINPLLTEGCLK